MNPFRRADHAETDRLLDSAHGSSDTAPGQAHTPLDVRPGVRPRRAGGAAARRGRRPGPPARVGWRGRGRCRVPGGPSRPDAVGAAPAARSPSDGWRGGLDRCGGRHRDGGCGLRRGQSGLGARPGRTGADPHVTNPGPGFSPVRRAQSVAVLPGHPVGRHPVAPPAVARHAICPRHTIGADRAWRVVARSVPRLAGQEARPAGQGAANAGLREAGDGRGQCRPGRGVLPAAGARGEAVGTGEGQPATPTLGPPHPAVIGRRPGGGLFRPASEIRLLDRSWWRRARPRRCRWVGLRWHSVAKAAHERGPDRW